MSVASVANTAKNADGDRRTQRHRWVCVLVDIGEVDFVSERGETAVLCCEVTLVSVG